MKPSIEVQRPERGCYNGQNWRQQRFELRQGNGVIDEMSGDVWGKILVDIQVLKSVSTDYLLTVGDKKGVKEDMQMPCMYCLSSRLRSPPFHFPNCHSSICFLLSKYFLKYLLFMKPVSILLLMYLFHYHYPILILTSAWEGDVFKGMNFICHIETDVIHSRLSGKINMYWALVKHIHLMIKKLCLFLSRYR